MHQQNPKAAPYDPAETTTLVRAAQAGDREAFGELVARFERAVYATALRRLRSHVEAEELCQEVFVRALEKLDQLRAPEAFGAWLRQIATRLAINRVSRATPALAGEPDLLSAQWADDRTPLQSALASERTRQVRDGLKRLGELDRATLTSFYVEGHSLVEMSDEFDSPVGTIKRRLHVARKRLAEELESLAC